MDNRKIKDLQPKTYIVVLSVLSISFFLLNSFTPLSGDDYAYCFYYDEASAVVRPTAERVTSFVQAVESMWNHYQTVNGRFLSHLTMQGFCALWGKSAFNVVNTLVFMLFLHILTLWSGRRNSVLVLALAFLASMWMLPFPGQTMLWLTGACNYLWPTTFALCYVYWLTHYVPRAEKWYVHAFALMAGLAISWTNESVSAPVALGLFIYYAFHRKTFKGLAASSYIGYGLGAALIVFSPGTFSRLETDSTVLPPLETDQFLFLHTYYLFYYFISFALPIIVVAFYTWKGLKHYRRPLAFVDSRLACIFLSFILFLWALGMDDADRVYFGVSAFSLAILLRAVEPLWDKLRFRTVISVFAALCCGLPIYAAAKDTLHYHEIDAEAKAIVKAAPEECVVRLQEKPESSRYCYYGGMESLSPDRFAFHTRVKAFYYGKEYIQALPDNIYNAWQADTLDHLQGYEVIALAADSIPQKSVTVRYTLPESTEVLAPRQRFIRHLFNTLPSTTETGNALLVTKGEKNYLLVHIKQGTAEFEIRI